MFTQKHKSHEMAKLYFRKRFQGSGGEDKDTAKKNKTKKNSFTSTNGQMEKGRLEKKKKEAKRLNKLG